MNTQPPPTPIERAKLSIARSHSLSEWSILEGGSPTPTPISTISTTTTTTITIGTSHFIDNTPRSPLTDFTEPHGDTLPQLPTVITGCCTEWPSYQSDSCWHIQQLAARTTLQVSLDGGPSFARQSICRGKVTLTEYEQYCHASCEKDAAPLYVFDPDILTSTFLDGTPIDSEFSTPRCFTNDSMGSLTGTIYRPLPPAWLLVGAARSGTPIHNHPYTVAWNALLSGTKLWCCLPPDVDEEFLLLNLDADGCIPDDEPFDLSALEWFIKIGQCELPKETQIIVQHPGEVVFLPKGWFHVVLNVPGTVTKGNDGRKERERKDVSVAISVSLTLRRDLIALFPDLIAEDPHFAFFWLRQLEQENAAMGSPDGSPEGKKESDLSADDLAVLKAMVIDYDARLLQETMAAGEKK